MLRLAIVGSVDFDDYRLLCREADKLGPTSIVSGGARGADSLAERYAEERGLPVVVFGAEWNRYGKSAGPRRNAAIVNAADAVLAFPIGESRGTRDTITKARARGLPVVTVETTTPNGRGKAGLDTSSEGQELAHMEGKDELA